MFQVRSVLLLIRWGFTGAQELRTPYPASPFFQEGSRWAVDLRPSTITPALRVYSHFLTSRPPDSSSKCLSKWAPSSCTLVRCPARTHLCSLRHFFAGLPVTRMFQAFMVLLCFPSRGVELAAGWQWPNPSGPNQLGHVCRRRGALSSKRVVRDAEPGHKLHSLGTRCKR